MIRITDLRHKLLDIPDLSVARHIAVIGPNGSGKTTLLSVCAELEEPKRGRVQILGKPPSAAKIGWVGEFPDRRSSLPGLRRDCIDPAVPPLPLYEGG